MPETRYKKECLEIFFRIEKQRNRIFSKMDALTDEQLHFNPHPAKWNLLQIVLHLVTSEKLAVIYIKRIMASDEEIQKAGVQSKLRSLALKIGLTLPVKFTAPKMTDTTGKDPDYKKLKSDWQKIRNELKNLIESLDENILKKELFEHPIVGNLNMKQMLEFMDTHTAHHRKQIRQIMRDSSFPERK